jgi:hypothetical protein
MSCTSSASKSGEDQSALSLEDSSDMSADTAVETDLTTINFDKTYTGKINKKYEVVFQLKNNANEISGSYFYTNSGIDIPLTGKMTGANTLEMYELDYLNNQVAKISGIIKDSTFSGNWENLKTKQVFPVALNETSLVFPAMPTGLEGNYTVETDDPEICNIAVQMTKNRGEYQYTFKTNQRDKKGKLQFIRLPEESVFIVFEGLIPDDQEGGTGIEGMLDETGIVIQNSGNAMNPFLMLKECDLKYIHLVKK